MPRFEAAGKEHRKKGKKTILCTLLEREMSCGSAHTHTHTHTPHTLSHSLTRARTHTHTQGSTWCGSHRRPHPPTPRVTFLESGK
jgi:hypothetical protein